MSLLSGFPRDLLADVGKFVGIQIGVVCDP